jgi:pyridoxal phosphate enzyme (YggS family)
MNLSERIERVREKILKSSIKVGADYNNIKLIAVTKTHSAELIDEAIKLGLDCIGENKVQEIEKKIPNLKNNYKELHFIGHLQSNKVNKLMKFNPTLIHSIDKISTLEKIGGYSKKNNRIQNVLIQINTSGEISKSGIESNEIYHFLDRALTISSIKIIGLMTIGTITNDEKEIRRCFHQLWKISENIKARRYGELEMKYLSMGMSNDFQFAIEEGANLIRVGSGLFGKRYYQKEV